MTFSVGTAWTTLSCGMRDRYGERCTIIFAYYQRSRTHLSLDKDAPIPRRVQPPELGKVVELPEVGGLHLALPWFVAT